MENILWVILAHYICDYPLQGTFLATTKGTNWYSMWAHCIIYALGVSLALHLMGVFALWKAAVLLCTHYPIDYVKATAKNKARALTSYLYIDQALHLLICLLVVLL